VIAALALSALVWAGTTERRTIAALVVLGVSGALVVLALPVAILSAVYRYGR
jgi:hypothetical protein